MQVFKIHSAKTNLSQILKQVEEGEVIAIARGNKVIARIIPEIVPAKKSRGYGAWKGLVDPVPDFLEPMSEEELSLWEDGPIDPIA
jgi:antitoxin (DNA-binding transcriptional repressor) of toxin-antitoxin stability system